RAPVEAVWLTDRAEPDGLQELAAWGADRVWLWQDAALAPYRGEGGTPALAELAKAEAPRAIWGAGTSRHRGLMARRAARLGTGIAADCVAFALTDGRLVATRPVYAGKLLARVRWTGSPWVATLRPNVFKAGQSDPGRALKVERPSATPGPAGTAFVER